MPRAHVRLVEVPKVALAAGRRSKFARYIALGIFSALALLYSGLTLATILFKWVNPPTTAVQIERRIESWSAPGHYTKRYRPVPMARISRELQHAVVAGEDTRFREHNGIDWVEVQKVIEEDLGSGVIGRGGSTITQQLVKNLFLSTRRSYVRKAIEFTLVPIAERLLGKDRILEMYLNVIEWGPGVYGAEAAAQYYYRIPASRLGREQATRLAAIIPNPRKRRPEQVTGYARVIEGRMRQMGW